MCFLQLISQREYITLLHFQTQPVLNTLFTMLLNQKVLRKHCKLQGSLKVGIVFVCFFIIVSHCFFFLIAKITMLIILFMFSNFYVIYTYCLGNNLSFVFASPRPGNRKGNGGKEGLILGSWFRKDCSPSRWGRRVFKRVWVVTVCAQSGSREREMSTGV